MRKRTPAPWWGVRLCSACWRRVCAKYAMNIAEELPGKPTRFTQALADEICEQLADGKSLRSICQREDMPTKAAVFRWLGEQEAFADQYARARESQADALADDIVDIADTPKTGQKKTTRADGKVEITEGDMIEHRRLQVDARKWVAAKLKPKKYGDRVAHELTGKDGGPIEHREALTDAELEAIARGSGEGTAAAPGSAQPAD